MTLAVKVRVRRVFFSGYGCVRPKREGLRTAGHKKRRKRDAEMSRWPISGLHWTSHNSTQSEKILCNSSGKCLKARQRLIRLKNTVFLHKMLPRHALMKGLLLPVDINNLLHHHFTGFLQVLLVVCQFRCKAFARINFTVLH